MLKRSTNFTSKIRGIVSFKENTAMVIPISKGDERSYFIKGKNLTGIRAGDLVDCLITRKQLRHVKIIKVLRKNILKKPLNHISLYEKGIPNIFSDKSMRECEKIELPSTFNDHKDFTHLPFITVDPQDAKDHDDAIYAIKGINGVDNFFFKVYVAIADVSFFVKENSEIDFEARDRGNSTYLPNLCIPMLPEKLSFNFCSLLEGEIRPCLVVEIAIDEVGKKICHTFHRAIIKNIKALTYEDVEIFRHEKTVKTLPYSQSLTDLWDLYDLLLNEKKDRSPLQLDFPERVISADVDDNVLDISNVKKNNSNQLVEELMILANISAAETIKKCGMGNLFRIHPTPSNEKIETFRNIKGAGSSITKNGSKITSVNLNEFVNSAKDVDEREIYKQEIIKLLEQARYSTKNDGHFGLNLKSYTHFTSPIRRYADIIIHRLIINFTINQHSMTISKKSINLGEICNHISFTERRSSEAERDTIRRYLAKYIRNGIEKNFEGTIIGFIRKVIFIKIDYLDAEGAIILKRGQNDSIYFDKDRKRFLHKHSSEEFNIGSRIPVTLIKANELNGSLTFRYNH
ncbi:MAG: RNB domain-containing ribonuclease [Paracoccaceae bacterium]